MGDKGGCLTSSTDRPENHRNLYPMPNTNVAEFQPAGFSSKDLNEPADAAHCSVSDPPLSTSATRLEYPALKFEVWRGSSRA